MEDTNWLEVCIKNGESVHTFTHFETWEEMLTEMDECWNNDLYEFHLGGPVVSAKVQPNLGKNETFGFLTRINGQYTVAMEVPQHYGHQLN
jgi:hypothetical protein